MEKLSQEKIDQELVERDERKPLRKVIDDHVIPAAGLAAGTIMGAAGTITGFKVNPRLHDVG